jgi:hypothetical protein
MANLLQLQAPLVLTSCVLKGAVGIVNNPVLQRIERSSKYTSPCSGGGLIKRSPAHVSSVQWEDEWGRRSRDSHGPKQPTERYQPFAPLGDGENDVGP